MAESKPGPAPPQGGDGPPESRLAEDFRRRRAVPLVHRGEKESPF